MVVVADSIDMRTDGEVEMVDVTAQARARDRGLDLASGIICIFNPGSTGALTTIEYEPGLERDMPEALERLFPKGIRYHHDDTWHDGNGPSHVRASMIGPSLAVPFNGGRLTLGTWQQIVFLEMDISKRERKVILQIMGE